MNTISGPTISGPTLKTSAAGKSLEKLLHILGGEVPDSCLRARAAGGDGGTCGLRFPGSAGGKEAVGSQHPILLILYVGASLLARLRGR